MLLDTSSHTYTCTNTHMFIHIQALDWCIESAAVLSEHDLVSSDLRSMDVKRVKRDIDQFLQNYPPPTDEEMHQLQELTEAIGNAWIKGNAEFAYNRVMEVNEKFQHYTKMLDGMMDGTVKTHQRKEAMGGQMVNGETEEVDGDEMVETDGHKSFLESRPAIPEVNSDVSLRSSQKGPGDSGDEIGLEEALLLLEDVAKSASDKLNSTSSDPGRWMHVSVGGEICEF